jgi:hypothetical protein
MWWGRKNKLKNNNEKKKETIENNSIKRDYVREFYQNEMSQIDRNIQWKDTYYIIDKDENVLMQLRYRLEATDDKGWYGQRDFHIYVVEKNGKRYCKLVNLMNLDEGFNTDCYEYFDGHVSACEEYDIRIFLPNYRKRLLENTEIIELDDEFDKLLIAPSNIDFEKSYLELFECKYKYSLLHFDCLDFYNKHVFVADGYCLKKYEPYILIINYIFSKSNYKYLNPSSIKIVDSLSIACKEMVEELERQFEFDMMIR